MRKGIILLGGMGKRFLPATSIINKHLIPIVDRPMFHFSLSTLMLAGIKVINIVSNNETIKLIKKSLGNGNKYGLNLSYTIQEKPRGIPEGISLSKKFIGKSNFALMLGDNFFYSSNLSNTLTKISRSNKNTLVTYKVSNPSEFGVLIQERNKIKKIIEKPKKFYSDLVVTGLYFYENEVVNLLKYIKPSRRKELEITDLNNIINKKKELYHYELERGSVWLDSGTPENHIKTTEFVRIIEERTNKKIGLIEEVAFQKGFISKNSLKKIIKTTNVSDTNLIYLKKIVK